MNNNPFDTIDNRLTNIEGLLNKLLNKQVETPQNQVDELGGISLAEQITGLKKATIYCHVHANKIPYFKKGGKLYFSKIALEEWIKEGARGSPNIQLATLLPEVLFPRQTKKRGHFGSTSKNK